MRCSSLLGNALLDASIAVWDSKVAFDYVTGQRCPVPLCRAADRSLGRGFGAGWLTAGRTLKN